MWRISFGTVRRPRVGFVVSSCRGCRPIARAGLNGLARVFDGDGVVATEEVGLSAASVNLPYERA